MKIGSTNKAKIVCLYFHNSLYFELNKQAESEKKDLCLFCVDILENYLESSKKIYLTRTSFRIKTIKSESRLLNAGRGVPKEKKQTKLEMLLKWFKRIKK